MSYVQYTNKKQSIEHFQSVQQIPPVDVPCNSSYYGCYQSGGNVVQQAASNGKEYRVALPAASQVQDPMGTNPLCPVKMCSCVAGQNCNCNMDHMRAPRVRRFWKYKWNQY